ncbi:hypothetical protein EV363DRAFT_1302273 [Boletus edulis]|nr:hypothetical protein EV363DRAFT_1302273 [Boletus edulis]
MTSTTTIATSRPPLTSPRILALGLSDFLDCSNAYEIILQAEEYAIGQESKGDVISARVVGYLLLEFHRRSHIIGDQPCVSLVRSVTVPIHGESRHDVVFHVGNLYFCKLIHLFRPLNVEYPPPSPQPSSPSFDGLEDLMEDSVEAAGEDYGTLRKKVLARDGYQCMVTGLFDANSLRSMLSPSLYLPIFQTHHAADYILESFGFSNLAETFKQPGGIHQACNMLSMQHDLQYKFDALRLWFESTDQKIPPPNSALLTLHAICARVVYMSGAAGLFDQLEWEAEEEVGEQDVKEWDVNK